MHVLAISNQKGGVAKTTTAVNIAAGLIARGRAVLAIDADAQGNLTQALGVKEEEIRHTTYEVLLNAARDPAFAIVPTSSGVFLIPATSALAGAEKLIGQVGHELYLRKALGNMTERYDFVVIDCPPALNVLTLNALCAADAVIVPVQAQALALRALPQLQEAVALAQLENPSLVLGGIVLTMTTRTLLAHAVEQQAREQYGELVFRATIPTSTILAESVGYGETIFTYAPSSPGAQAYAALAEEIEKRYAATE